MQLKPWIALIYALTMPICHGSLGVHQFFQFSKIVFRTISKEYLDDICPNNAMNYSLGVNVTCMIIQLVPDVHLMHYLSI